MDGREGDENDVISPQDFSIDGIEADNFEEFLDNLRREINKKFTLFASTKTVEKFKADIESKFSITTELQDSKME